MTEWVTACVSNEWVSERQQNAIVSATPARCARLLCLLVLQAINIEVLKKARAVSGITWRGDDAANAGDVFQSKLEEHQLHGLLANGIIV